MDASLGILLFIAVVFVATVLRNYKDWKHTGTINSIYGTATVLFAICLLLGGNQYIKHKEFEDNLNAVYDYFGEEDVHYVSLDLTEVETDAGTYKIKVDQGLVMKAHLIKEKNH
ncbi:hypothetical protein [Priestia megaterium]|uniref:hypothetical protein n=1 Tax=Priestia megaterium TaxID=1404 RepID=UPI0031018FE3